MRFLWAVLVVSCALLAAWWSHGQFWQLPDRYNPWAPFSVAEIPGPLTPFKLARLERGPPEQCLAALKDAGMSFTPVADQQTGTQCGYTNVVRMQSTPLQINPSFLLSCRAAVSLALWQQHVVQPQAQALLGAPVQRIEHMGSYACRNVYGRETGNRSRHATADALDVSGFVLQGGKRVNVARDWSGTDAEAQFLHSIHDGACKFFDGVLGPNYNREHANHFHLDKGGWGLCR